MTDPSAPTLPSFTVVIEWENAKLSDFDRSRQMLASLAEQIRELRSRLESQPEIIVLHDRVEIDGKRVEQAVAETLGEPDLAILRFVATDHRSYYQQKNIGASQAETEVVIFLDSDVIPQPRWLETLLETIAEPHIEVVGGNTFMDAETFLARAFSLFWIFHPESGDEELRRSDHFFANNVAFRRSLITSSPFPDLPTQRGQCTMLAQTLLASGHDIYVHDRARVNHPPPNGVAHVVVRAMAQGRDDYLLGNAREPHRFDSRLANCMWRFRKRVVGAAKRFVRGRKSVGLGAFGAVAAMGLAFVYYVFYLVGVAITLVDRDLVTRRFPI